MRSGIMVTNFVEEYGGYLKLTNAVLKSRAEVNALLSSSWLFCVYHKLALSLYPSL